MFVNSWWEVLIFLVVKQFCLEYYDTIVPIGTESFVGIMNERNNGEFQKQ